ncbi:MAG: MFS transporter [Candidatus Eisenbacteria bacterium]
MPRDVARRTPFGKAARAWCMYDWANSAFATTIASALFPPFFRSLATASGLAESTATAYWGYTASAALLLVAVIAPLLGATADHTGGKKRYMAAFAAFGMVFTASFFLIGDGAWKVASFLYVAAALGFAGANVFYDSFLPHVADPPDVDRLSSRGFALGYLGGGLLLVLNVLWVTYPETFGMPGRAFAMRASFASVAVWWALFSIPFWRHVPEPPFTPRRERGAHPLVEGIRRLAETAREVGHYRQLTLFLVAFWVYTDGVGTIVRMATAYGHEIGIGVTDMMVALVITQVVAIPCTLIFARLARRVGPKASILLTLAVYAVVAGSAYYMRTAAHFYALSFAVGTVQGGCQALSRSLFARMVPIDRSAEFFGFYSTSSKFAGVFGPLVFGVLSQATGQSRLGIVSVVAFFVVGAALLSRVNVQEGVMAAAGANRV